MDTNIARLKQVLEVAATAPGNLRRFQQAGFFESSNNPEKLQISPNWKPAFLKLQAIDKQTVRQHPGLFLADINDLVYRGTTSGSRGKSFIYFAGSEWNKARILARSQSLQWWGIDDNIPIINLASRLFPVRAIDLAIAGKIDLDFIEILLKELVQRPVVIRGYPSRLCEVATYLTSKQTPPVIAVICTGECLFEYQQKLLETVFQAPVIEEYGCQETGISGMTCPENRRLHLDTERCLYEIIDGQLVTTDLYNYVMPLVRYKCGDIIDLNTDTCPCGRPGFTGKIWGRIEDYVRTSSGIKHPGEIPLPPFEDILNYQLVRREGRHIDLWLKPEDSASFNQHLLEPIITWIQVTFGEVSAQIFVDDTEEKHPQTEPSCTDKFWISSVTSSSWGKFLKEAKLPTGEARKAAQLWKKLVDSDITVYSGLPASTQECLSSIIHSPPCQDLYTEKMTARVLLFSCNFLADQPEVATIYTQAAERLKHSLKLLGENDDAALIDQFIPSLFLNIDTAKSIWLAHPLPIQCQLDTFNIHNLLSAFESASRRVVASGSKIISQKLKPILSVLIGDLNFFAPRFGTWLLAHWCELIHGKSIIQPHSPETLPADKFCTAWLAWRQELIRGGHNTHLKLSALQNAAISPEEQARVYIEKGYGLLLAGEELKPHEWLDIIEANAGLMGQGRASEQVDPVPWIPIIRSLAKPLLKQGEPELAYQCLVASTMPSSHTSAFERKAFQVNDKQSVISDICPEGDLQP